MLNKTLERDSASFKITRATAATANESAKSTRTAATTAAAVSYDLTHHLEVL